MKRVFALVAVVIAVLALVFTWQYLSTTKKKPEKKIPAKTGTTKEKAKEPPPARPSEKQKVIIQKITVYFSDDQAQYLLLETREAPPTKKPEEIASFALQELIKGPKDKNHFPTLPEGVSLLGVEIKNGIAYVNFNSQLEENFPSGSAGGAITLYSIVNTLTELPEIDKVKLLIEGTEVESLGEYADLAEPLARNEDIIKAE